MKAAKCLCLLFFIAAVSPLSWAQLTYTTTLGYLGCPSNSETPNLHTFSNWVYKDSSGVNHSFVGSDYDEYFGKYGAPPKSCGAEVFTSLDAFSTDGLYYLTATGSSGTVTALLNGIINPKYVVVGVTYAPPGSSSTVAYTGLTSVGSTTTLMNSFQSDTGFSVSVSTSVGIQAGQIINGGYKLVTTESTNYTQGSSSSTTNTISKSSSISYVTAGTPTFSPVTSDNDFIWIWINPEIVVSYLPQNGSTPANVHLIGYAFDPTDPVSGEPPPSGSYIAGPDIVEVQVGCLDGHIACPSTLVINNGVVTSGTLARSWAANEYSWPAGEGPGLTTADIAQILTFDPFVPSNSYTLLNSLPSTTSDGRFTKEPFPPNPVEYPVGAATETYSTVQTDTQSVASGTSNSVKQAFGVSESFGGGFADLWDSTVTLTESQTLTWTYSWLNTLTTTTTLTNALSVKSPPDPPPTYNGPTEFIAYQDNIFGTFAFVPVNP
jgi:hypothetical protein